MGPCLPATCAATCQTAPDDSDRTPCSKAMQNDPAFRDGQATSAFLVGDLAYACGTMFKWDAFLSFVEPLAASVPLMVTG